MAQENIKLTKTIYSTKSTDGIVDRSFSEFFKTKDPVNLNRFFSIYGELFYDIPKKGKNSHTSIIKQSTDYIKNYVDPRDEQITFLTERIVELEEQLNKPVEEHPFYKNGTLISIDENVNDDGSIGNGNPDDSYVHYMDRGVKREVIGGSNGEVFKALRGALGYPNNATDNDMVKILPRVVFDGITSGNTLGIEDVMGLTNTLEMEQEQLADIVVSDWRVELSNLIQPIENGSVQDENIYIALLKSKIISEFEREGQLESLSNKYYLDATQGFTQQEKDNGETLLSLVRPKVLRSRQTLAILKRIWDRKENFPNIMFDEILPRSVVDSGGNRAADKDGNPEFINPITEEEVMVYKHWDQGRNLFEGVLEGGEYVVTEETGGTIVTENSEGYLNIGEKSEEAYSLLDQEKIKIIYKKEKWKIVGGWEFDKWVTRYSHFDYQGGALERYSWYGYKYK